MSIFLVLSFLFFIGSVAGWVMELFYRNFHKPINKWVNPGFCTGPYVPLYGFGLCILYLIAEMEQFQWIVHPIGNKVVLFLIMAVCMTLIEYLAGLLCVKVFKVRLWDYSEMKGNIQGIICPQFSLIWTALGAIYYFFIHPHILEALKWLSSNLAFSFVIGLFFGVFLIDVANSAQLTVKLKTYAEAHHIVIKYEHIKSEIRKKYDENKQKYNFFHPFRTDKPLSDVLRDLRLSFETHIRKK